MRGRVLLTLASIASTPLAAQQGTDSVPTTDLRIGERVRITSSNDGKRKVVGAMKLLHPDSIVIDTSAVRRNIPFFSGGAIPVEQFRFVTYNTRMVRQIEVSRGASRWKGTRRGIIWGAVVGTAVRVAMHVGSGPQIRPLEGAGGDLARTAAWGAAGGAAVGGALGFLLPTERWIPVQLPWRGGVRGRQAP